MGESEGGEILKRAPGVSFGLNEELDIWKINMFLNNRHRRGGMDARKWLLQAHPRPGEPGVVSSYVGEFYAENRERLGQAANEVLQTWDGYAPQFFGAAAEIFKGLNWPPGKYIGYISIGPPFPRFLHDKTFQAPWEPVERAIRVTAHELLHFLFFEYVRKRYTPQLKNTVEEEMSQVMGGKFSIPLWELSEIFNIVVLNPQRFGPGGQTQSALGYPHLARFVPAFERIWNERGEDIDDLFTRLEVSN